MKEIEDTMEIVTKEKAEHLDKTTNVSIMSKLAENKYLIKYSGQVSDNIRTLFSNDPLNTESNENLKYTKTDLRKLRLNKPRIVPSAIHIAAAISAYARMSINEYKNIPGNPCIKSDTDSATLPKPLPKYLVGPKIGQMKLEHEIIEAIFFLKKLLFSFF